MHSKKDKNIEKLKKQISKLETKYELIKADLYYTDIRAMNRHQAHRIYKSLMENLKNRRKLYQNYQPSISEYLESKKFVSKNKKKIISKINLYTNANFTEEELIEAELNNFINNEKRNEIIESVCERLLNEKMTEIEYHNLLIILGINIKNKIIFETYNYPEKFIPLKEAEKANPNTTLFMEGILSKLLISNKVTVAIRKDNQNESDKIALSLLSAISTGEAFKKIITLTYNIDEKKNPLLLTDEEVQKKFLSKKRNLYSQSLKIPEKKINMLKIGYKSYAIEISNDKIIDDEEEDDILPIIKQSDEEIFNITFNSLLAGCQLTENMFDKKGDKINKYDWGKHKERGPPDNLQEYHPPIGYIGFGLIASRQYDDGDDTWLSCDNVDGEWYIGYHGTGSNDIIGKIINMGLVPGEYQDYSDEKNINQFSYENFPLCGRGVYLTPDVDEAEEYSGRKKGILLNNVQYDVIFMCRVNPFKVRIADKADPAYWVVGGDSQGNNQEYKISEECRPYRILLKKSEEDDVEFSES
jgi:hypothetical protein